MQSLLVMGNALVEICSNGYVMIYNMVVDIMVLVCHWISQERVTKGWNNIIGKSLSWQVSSFPSLDVIGTVAV